MTITLDEFIDEHAKNIQSLMQSMMASGAHSDREATNVLNGIIRDHCMSRHVDHVQVGPYGRNVPHALLQGILSLQCLVGKIGPNDNGHSSLGGLLF